MKETANKHQRIRGLIDLMQKNMECAICLDLLRNPVSTKCDHQFCRFCITEFLQTKASVPCPLCKQPITKRSLIGRPKLGDIVKGIRDVIQAFESDTGSPVQSGSVAGLTLPETSNLSSKRTLPNRQDDKNQLNIRHSKRRKTTEDTHVFIDDIVEPEEAPNLLVTHVNVSNGFPPSKCRRGTAKIKATPAYKKLDNKELNEDNKSLDVNLLQYLAEGSCGEISPISPSPSKSVAANETKINNLCDEPHSAKLNIKDLKLNSVQTVAEPAVIPEIAVSPASTIAFDSGSQSEGEIILAEEDFVKAISAPQAEDSKLPRKLVKLLRNSPPRKISRQTKASKASVTKNLDYGFMQETFGQSSGASSTTSFGKGSPGNLDAQESQFNISSSAHLDKSKTLRTYEGAKRNKSKTKWIYQTSKAVFDPSRTAETTNVLHTGNDNEKMSADNLKINLTTEPVSTLDSCPPVLSRRIFKRGKDSIPGHENPLISLPAEVDPYEFIPSQRTPKAKRKKTAIRVRPQLKKKGVKKPPLTVLQSKSLRESRANFVNEEIQKDMTKESSISICGNEEQNLDCPVISNHDLCDNTESAQPVGQKGFQEELFVDSDADVNTIPPSNVTFSFPKGRKEPEPANGHIKISKLKGKKPVKTRAETSAKDTKDLEKLISKISQAEDFDLMFCSQDVQQRLSTADTDTDMELAEGHGSESHFPSPLKEVTDVEKQLPENMPGTMKNDFVKGNQASQKSKMVLPPYLQPSIATVNSKAFTNTKIPDSAAFTSRKIANCVSPVPDSVVSARPASSCSTAISTSAPHPRTGSPSVIQTTAATPVIPDSVALLHADPPSSSAVSVVPNSVTIALSTASDSRTQSPAPLPTGLVSNCDVITSEPSGKTDTLASPTSVINDSVAIPDSVTGLKSAVPDSKPIGQSNKPSTAIASTDSNSAIIPATAVSDYVADDVAVSSLPLTVPDSEPKSLPSKSQLVPTVNTSKPSPLPTVQNSILQPTATVIISKLESGASVPCAKASSPLPSAVPHRPVPLSSDVGPNSKPGLSPSMHSTKSPPAPLPSPEVIAPTLTKIGNLLKSIQMKRKPSSPIKAGSKKHSYSNDLKTGNGRSADVPASDLSNGKQGEHLSKEISKVNVPTISVDKDETANNGCENVTGDLKPWGKDKLSECATNFSAASPNGPSVLLYTEDSDSSSTEDLNIHPTSQEYAKPVETLALKENDGNLKQKKIISSPQPNKPIHLPSLPEVIVLNGSLESTQSRNPVIPDSLGTEQQYIEIEKNTENEKNFEKEKKSEKKKNAESEKKSEKKKNFEKKKSSEKENNFASEKNPETEQNSESEKKCVAQNSNEINQVSKLIAKSVIPIPDSESIQMSGPKDLHQPDLVTTSFEETLGTTDVLNSTGVKKTQHDRTDISTVNIKDLATQGASEIIPDTLLGDKVLKPDTTDKMNLTNEKGGRNQTDPIKMPDNVPLAELDNQTSQSANDKMVQNETDSIKTPVNGLYRGRNTQVDTVDNYSTGEGFSKSCAKDIIPDECQEVEAPESGTCIENTNAQSTNDVIPDSCQYQTPETGSSKDLSSRSKKAWLDQTGKTDIISDTYQDQAPCSGTMDEAPQNDTSVDVLAAGVSKDDRSARHSTITIESTASENILTPHGNASHGAGSEVISATPGASDTPRKIINTSFDFQSKGMIPSNETVSAEFPITAPLVNEQSSYLSGKLSSRSSDSSSCKTVPPTPDVSKRITRSSRRKGPINESRKSALNEELVSERKIRRSVRQQKTQAQSNLDVDNAEKSFSVELNSGEQEMSLSDISKAKVFDNSLDSVNDTLPDLDPVLPPESLEDLTENTLPPTCASENSSATKTGSLYVKSKESLDISESLIDSKLPNKIPDQENSSDKRIQDRRGRDKNTDVESPTEVLVQRQEDINCEIKTRDEKPDLNLGNNTAEADTVGTVNVVHQNQRNKRKMFKRGKPCSANVESDSDSEPSSERLRRRSKRARNLREKTSQTHSLSTVSSLSQSILDKEANVENSCNVTSGNKALLGKTFSVSKDSDVNRDVCGILSNLPLSEKLLSKEHASPSKLKNIQQSVNLIKNLANSQTLKSKMGSAATSPEKNTELPFGISTEPESFQGNMNVSEICAEENNNSFSTQEPAGSILKSSAANDFSEEAATESLTQRPKIIDSHQKDGICRSRKIRNKKPNSFQDFEGSKMSSASELNSKTEEIPLSRNLESNKVLSKASSSREIHSKTDEKGLSRNSGSNKVLSKAFSKSSDKRNINKETLCNKSDLVSTTQDIEDSLDHHSSDEISTSKMKPFHPKPTETGRSKEDKTFSDTMKRKSSRKISPKTRNNNLDTTIESDEDRNNGVIYVKRGKKPLKAVPVIIETDSDSSEPFDLNDLSEASDNDVSICEPVLRSPSKDTAAVEDTLPSGSMEDHTQGSPSKDIAGVEDTLPSETMEEHTQGDDGSEANKTVNITTSSAFSSQSEVFSSQQRSKLEGDVERMRKEIEALEAQLATRDSILMDTTLTETTQPPCQMNQSCAESLEVGTEKELTNSDSKSTRSVSHSTVTKTLDKLDETQQAISCSSTDKLSSGTQNTTRAKARRGIQKQTIKQQPMISNSKSSDNSAGKHSPISLPSGSAVDLEAEDLSKAMSEIDKSMPVTRTNVSMMLQGHNDITSASEKDIILNRFPEIQKNVPDSQEGFGGTAEESQKCLKEIEKNNIQDSPISTSENDGSPKSGKEILESLKISIPETQKNPKSIPEVKKSLTKMSHGEKNLKSSPERMNSVTYNIDESEISVTETQNTVPEVKKSFPDLPENINLSQKDCLINNSGKESSVKETQEKNSCSVVKDQCSNIVETMEDEVNRHPSQSKGKRRRIFTRKIGRRSGNKSETNLDELKLNKNIMDSVVISPNSSGSNSASNLCELKMTENVTDFVEISPDCSKESTKVIPSSIEETHQKKDPEKALESDDDLTNEIPPTDNGLDDRGASSSEESEDLFLSPRSPSPPPPQPTPQNIQSSAVSKAVSKLKELFKTVSPGKLAESPDKRYSTLSQTPPSTPKSENVKKDIKTPVNTCRAQIFPTNLASSFRSPAFGVCALSKRPVSAAASPASDLLRTPLRDSSSVTRRLCFVTTGLHLKQSQRTQHFAQMFDAKIQPKFSPAATHVIVKPVQEASLVCDRTFKYFQGIAHHCWIVSYQWVEDSIRAKELLPETGYEMQGDTVSGPKHRGPRRSRLSTVPIFNDLEVYCRGHSPDIPPGEFEKLLSVLGATVVTSAEALGIDPDKTQLVIELNDDPSPTDIRIFNRLYKEYGVVTVSREWVFNSITLYKTQPLQEHILTALPDIEIPFV